MILAAWALPDPRLLMIQIKWWLIWLKGVNLSFLYLCIILIMSFCFTLSFRCGWCCLIIWSHPSSIQNQGRLRGVNNPPWNQWWCCNCNWGGTVLSIYPSLHFECRSNQKDDWVPGSFGYWTLDWDWFTYGGKNINFHIFFLFCVKCNTGLHIEA